MHVPLCMFAYIGPLFVVIHLCVHMCTFVQAYNVHCVHVCIYVYTLCVCICVYIVYMCIHIFL